MYDRRLLAKLSQCAWKVLSLYLKQGVPFVGASPGAVVVVQTFGDFLNFNPHLHIIATDGCFDDQDGFMVGPQSDPKALEHAFRLEEHIPTALGQLIRLHPTAQSGLIRPPREVALV